MPELTPYEFSVYIYILRNTKFKENTTEIRIGKRTIAKGYGIGSRGTKTNFEHINSMLKSLEKKGCIRIGDSNRNGTLLTIILPEEIPIVKEKKINILCEDSEEDYFNDPKKRQLIFERDEWICQYCGDKVTTENASIDHFIPQSKRGKHNKENLRTCCFICNSIKSGHTFEEAAPSLLKSVQERKQKKNLD